MKYEEKIESFELLPETKELLKRQLYLYKNYKNKNNNEIKIKGDIITLNRNSLIHGTRANIDDLETISKTGLISSEFYSELNINKKKPYVVELWDVKEELELSKWIDKYTGVTIDFKNRNGEIYKSVISSFDKIKNVISFEKDFRDYIIYQNQEQRFLPNDIIENDASLAFIVEYNKNDELINNDIFNIDFDKDILKDLLPDWFYEKYMITRKFDNYETGREKAILFGIPVSMIKGIMISRKLEKDNNVIQRIRELFPKCYICNLDGIVI